MGGAPKHSTQLAPVADRLLDLLVGSILLAKFLLGYVEVLDEFLCRVVQVFGQIIKQAKPTMHVSVHSAYRVALVVPLNVDRLVFFVTKAWNHQLELICQPAGTRGVSVLDSFVLGNHKGSQLAVLTLSVPHLGALQSSGAEAVHLLGPQCS